MKSTRFADVRKSFVDMTGLPAKDLLPLIPVGTEVGEFSKIMKNQIGKIPGRYAGGKWYGLTGSWPSFGLSPSDQELAANWPTPNVGLRAADWPGVDLDVNSFEARDFVEELLSSVLGPAPVRERGKTPRVIHVYRRKGDMPIRKVKVTFQDDKNVTHAVEVLGFGQQYVINGIHPEGDIYEWRDGKDLRQYTVSELTQVSADQIAEFAVQLENAIVAKGWTLVKSSKPKYGRGVDGPALVVSELEPLASKELALAALNTLENTMEFFPERADILALTSSFKHVLGKEADSAYPEFALWAVKDGWADEPYIKSIWNSLTAVRVSPDHLFALARRRGFRGDAVADFAGMEMDGEERVNGQMDAAVGEAGAREAELKALASKLVYWAEDMTWIVRGTAEMYSHTAFNHAPRYGVKIAPAGTTGQRSATSLLLNLPEPVEEVKGVTYLAGQPEVVAWEKEGRKGKYYNRWHSIPHVLPDKVEDEDVETWLKHVRLVIPRAAEREHFLDYMAFLVQHRGRKVRYAPIIVGSQGTGKDLMLRPLVQYFAHNCEEITPEKLTGQFNDYVERELIIVQEMAQQNRKEAYDQVKVLIAGSGKDTLSVERKYKNPYSIPNNVNLVFFSNHMDAVQMEDDDRRFFVIKSDMVKQEDAYYVALADTFYKHRSGWRKVIRWLLQRDVTQFKPDATPPDTIGKQEMKDAQRPGYLTLIKTQLESGFHKDRTVMTAKELFETVKSDFNYPLDPRERGYMANINKAVEALRKAGWTQHASPVRVDGAPTRVWVRHEKMLAEAATKLRDLLEKERKEQKS